MSRELIRILIVDDHAVACEGPKYVISREIDTIVANEASTRGGALKLLDANSCGGARDVYDRSPAKAAIAKSAPPPLRMRTTGQEETSALLAGPPDTGHCELFGELRLLREELAC
jgi:hypothetical protein